jgi:PiT family inorganic phosphate transporter
MHIDPLLGSVIALVFEYINGFHDAANSIATVVSTRVLTPGRAVAWVITIPASAAVAAATYEVLVFFGVS